MVDDTTHLASVGLAQARLNNICIYFQKSSDMLNKNTLGVKKVQGQSEAALQIGMCDQKLGYHAVEAKKLLIKILFNYLNGIQ